MATYLDRYLRGEHERVWNELVALGERVREPGVNDDAVAVARETMRRARANVERIVERLRRMDFEFAYPDEAFVPPGPSTVAILDSLEGRIGPFPIAVRAFYETVGSVCLAGSHAGLSTYVKPTDLGATVRAYRAIYEQAIGPLPPMPNASSGSSAADLVHRLENAGIALPPGSIDMIDQVVRLQKAFADQASGALSETDRMTTAGEIPGERLERAHRLASDIAKHLRQTSKVGSVTPVVSDPLVVDRLRGDDPDSYRHFGADDDEGDEDGWGGAYAIDVAPDAAHKAGQSGGGPYQILLPNAAADGPLLDSPYPTFVAYLRESFRWGGFPGLARYTAPRELTLLVEGLEPI